MNLSISRLMMVSAFAAAFHLSASTAGAQTVKFDLPFEAHWGSTVLPAGNYTLSTLYSPSSTKIYYLHSSAGNRMAVPTIVDTKDASGSRSCLRLVRINGQYYVREYVSPTSGVALEYATPQNNGRELRAAAQWVVEVSGS